MRALLRNNLTPPALIGSAVCLLLVITVWIDPSSKSEETTSVLNVKAERHNSESLYKPASECGTTKSVPEDIEEAA